MADKKCVIKENFQTYYAGNSGGSTSNIVIGTLPGYNQNTLNITTGTSSKFIDLQTELTKNVLPIQFKPVTYNLGIFHNFLEGVVGKILHIEHKGVQDDDEKTTSSVTSKEDKNLFSIAKSKITGSLFKYNATNNNNVSKMFKSLINSEYLGIVKNEKKEYIFKDNDTPTILLLGANDTTQVETLSNNFGESSLGEMVDGMTSMKGLSWFNKAGNYAKKIAHMDYDAALTMATTNTGTFFDALIAKSLGLQIAFPKAWQNSTFDQQVSIFLKLTSPTGYKKDIEKFIINPLKVLLTMAAPMSTNLLTYGTTLIWNIEIPGNSSIKIGAIKTMTITRGANDTPLNEHHVPLSLDVRINLVNLTDHFANIIDPTKISTVFGGDKGLSTDVLQQDKSSKSYKNNPYKGSAELGMYTPPCITENMVKRDALKDLENISEVKIARL